jgi:hypothetical protein
VGYYQRALAEDPEFAEEARSYWRRAIREKPELAQTYFEPAAS